MACISPSIQSYITLTGWKCIELFTINIASPGWTDTLSRRGAYFSHLRFLPYGANIQMGVFKSVAVATISTSVAHERGVSILLCRRYWSMVCESGRTLRNTCGFWRRYLTIAIRTLVCSSWSPETIWLTVLKQLPSPRIRVVFCGSWSIEIGLGGFKWE